MARYTDAVCKLCRRENEKLFLKGQRCASNKCSFEKRGYPPGQHGKSRRFKVSDYGIQLREKQKIRDTYGLLENQFKNFFKKAEREKGITGDNLVKMLERRLDNVVYRMGFAPSRKSARQLVRHRHFIVDGRVVDIPSFLVKPGAQIKVRDKSRKLEIIHSSIRRLKEAKPYSWLELDKANLTGVFLEIPQREDIPLSAQEQLVVELYSK
ncbi:MAG: 30S ribosomal protein S4 [bacterium]|nr:30S ribosomal protein S4 [bacterium]